MGSRHRVNLFRDIRQGRTSAADTQDGNRQEEQKELGGFHIKLHGALPPVTSPSSHRIMSIAAIVHKMWSSFLIAHSHCRLSHHHTSRQRSCSLGGLGLRHPTFYPVFLPSLFQVFPVEAESVVAWPPLGIAVGAVVVVLLGAVVVPPGVVVVPFDVVVGIAFGASNLGRPKYSASPNVCSFPKCASSVGLVGGVFVGSSIDALSNDAPGSHSSNLMVSLDKRMERFDSSPNLNYSCASDTSALPTDATTNHCRKRFPHPSQEQHRHSSRVSLRPVEVRQIR